MVYNLNLIVVAIMVAARKELDTDTAWGFPVSLRYKD